jgi:excinuclease ABC subunit A
MCPDCNGLGTKYEFDPTKFVQPDRSLHDGGVRSWGVLRKKKSSSTYKYAQQIVTHFGHDLDTPWRDLSPECQHAILYGGVRIVWEWRGEHGSGRHEHISEGEVNTVRRRYGQTQSEGSRRWYASFMGQQPCPTCHGVRLRPESAAVTVGGRTIVEVTSSEHP